MSHTPAPWSASFNPLEIGGHTDEMASIWYTQKFPNGEVGSALVAVVSRSTGDIQAKANAKLIAAAPELLEALITALPYLETAELDEAYKKGAVKKVTEHVRNAIKKATL